MLQHSNAPKGNVRKVITLKNKLPPGVFDGIKRLLFARSDGKEIIYLQETEALRGGL